MKRTIVILVLLFLFMLNLNGMGNAIITAQEHDSIDSQGDFCQQSRNDGYYNELKHNKPDSNRETAFDLRKKLSEEGSVIWSQEYGTDLDFSGITWDGTFIYIAGRSENKIYKFNPVTKAIIANYTSPIPEGGRTHGIAFDGIYFWITEHYSSNEKIYKLDPNNLSLVLDSFEAPGTWPTGLAWDGQFLWNADSQEDRVYKINITTKSSVVAYDVGDAHPQAVAWNGLNSLLYANYGDDYSCKKIDISSSWSNTGSFTLPKSDTEGMIVVNGSVWVTDRGEHPTYDYNRRLYQIDLGADNDSDGMLDYWESLFGLTIGTNDAGGDMDGDGIPNWKEFVYRTFPNNSDSDGDGYDDLYELNAKTYPLNPHDYSIIDSLPPVTVVNISSTPEPDGMYLENVTVTLTANDDVTGVAETRYSLDGTSWNVYSGPFTLTSDGFSKIYYHSIDNTGNSEDIKVVPAALHVTDTAMNDSQVHLEIVEQKPFILFDRYLEDGNLSTRNPFVVTWNGSDWDETQLSTLGWVTSFEMAVSPSGIPHVIFIAGDSGLFVDGDTGDSFPYHCYWTGSGWTTPVIIPGPWGDAPGNKHANPTDPSCIFDYSGIL
ncbi:MAG: OmpL47-type beta-barrel domain-containing protein, partial [Candidatus Hodarchaeales archaeon]